MFAAIVAAAMLTCASVDAPAARVDRGDLLRLHDISGLSVSPDGERVAFQIQRADPDANAYQSTWCVAPISSGERAIAVGDGGDMAMPSLSGLGRLSGVWVTLAARWSPDGGHIAFLARRADQTQIEACRTDGGGCRRVSESSGDVQDLVWTADGQGLIFQAAYPRVLARETLAREGERGFHFDDRFDVYHSLMPIRSSEQRPTSLRRVDVLNGVERAATAEEQVRFLSARRPAISTAMGSSRIVSVFSAAPTSPPPLPEGRDIRNYERLGAEGAIWLEPSDPSRAGMVPPLRLHARDRADAAALACASPLCSGRIVEFGATPDGRSVFFIRREGWAFSRHGLYLWTLATGQVRTLTVTDDVIRVCTPLAERAICFHEGPARPRSVVAIDNATGALESVFDPNPHLPPQAFVSARKLEWRAPDGAELFGYLLTPPGPRRGRLPLIVVQYRATGFLRGGVGDEYPIQAFVRRGFAVLALERPDPMDLMATIRDDREFDRREWRDLSERWRTLAALQSAVARVIDRGVADPARVGITGLSDGAETAVFAMIHCACAAAYSITGGIHDPISLYFTSGTRREEMREDGRGESAFGEGASWPDLSLALNAARVGAPILAHVADRELLFTLQAHRTFTDLGLPFDLYVFPDEYHVKWQPRHRQAVYERNLDWFAFWLLGEEDADPAKADQYRRWRAWRAAAATPSGDGRGGQ